MQRPNTRLLNPHFNAGPITEHDLPLSRLNELLALDALAARHGTGFDIRTLRTSFNLARALVGLGYGIGSDEAQVLECAGQALRETTGQPADALGLDRAGIDALRSMVLLLDAQRAACGGPDYTRALLRVQRECGRAQG